MDPKFFTAMTNSSYSPLWNKYRPVILQLMIAAGEGPQEYRMLSNEFKALNPRQTGGYTFTLQAFQGKAQNNIKMSVAAQDLMVMLTNSRRATELLDQDKFEFTLDRQFILHVSKLAAA